MSLIKNKYVRLSIDIERSEHRELLGLVCERDQTLAGFVRRAIRQAVMEAKEQAQSIRLHRVT